jgi:hypothetical protein
MNVCFGWQTSSDSNEVLIPDANRLLEFYVSANKEWLNRRGAENAKESSAFFAPLRLKKIKSLIFLQT